MPKFLNVTAKKVGGLWFLSFGRINISFSVSSRETYARKQHKAAYAALQADFDRVTYECENALAVALA